MPSVQDAMRAITFVDEMTVRVKSRQSKVIFAQLRRDRNKSREWGVAARTTGVSAGKKLSYSEDK